MSESNYSLSPIANKEIKVENVRSFDYFGHSNLPKFFITDDYMNLGNPQAQQVELQELPVRSIIQ